jgi:hypothetical protein
MRLKKHECELMSRSSYDPEALLQRAALWRAEAAAASREEVRAFCLAEADRCERRVQESRSTPVFRDASDR